MAASRLRNRIRLGLLIFWGGAVFAMFYGMQARGVEPGVLRSDERVEVTVSPESFRFTPLQDSRHTGLVFYPGALVDPGAYATMARAIADAGFPVAIVRVPYRMDLMDWQWRAVVDRTIAITEAGGDSMSWVVGGHSRGGKMATRFATEYPDALQGLLLLATSHPRERDLSGIDLDVVKISGTEDGLASLAEVRQFAGNLPADTRFEEVEGGNHSGFAQYGWQLGAGKATISAVAQREAATAVMLDQLRRLGAPPAAMLGEFEDDYGIRYEISESLWHQLPDTRYRVLQWSSRKRTMIAQNDASSAAAPGQWTRIDWVELEDMEPYEWAFCIQAYDSASPDEARRAPSSGRTTPRTGCNDFPFSRMRRVASEGR